MCFRGIGQTRRSAIVEANQCIGTLYSQVDLAIIEDAPCNPADPRGMLDPAVSLFAEATEVHLLMIES